MAHDQSPTLRRRELGSRLRELRHEAGLSVEDVAERLLCSPAKISRIETSGGTRGAGRGVSLRDVRDLCDLYQVAEAERTRLMSLARESQQRAWWQEFEVAVAYKTFIGLETSATCISEFQSGPIPGLLQTEAYARALTEGILPKLDPHIVQQVVETRIRRQEILTRERPPQLWVVLDEAVLRRAVGGPVVMQEQLAVLEERARFPNVTIQVIPFEFGAHPGINSNFIVLEFDEPAVSDVVYVEGQVGQIYLERRADIERYKWVFDHIRAVALGPKDSLNRIQAIRENYQQ